MTIKKQAILLALLIAILYLWHLGSYPLMNPDEGRYAEIPREMLASGNFITPHLNGVEYFEKPALQYWITAVFMTLFGQNEFAVRLFPALCGLGGIFTVYILSSKMFSRRAGLAAALILATSVLYFIISSINILDMAVSFFITLALSSFYLFTADRRPKYLYLSWAAMACAVLTKGLIGIVLPGIIAVIYIAWLRQWHLLAKIFNIKAIALFLLITVPWFYLVCRDNPDFFYFFFIQEHFLRYATTMHDRYQPFYFFVPCIVLGLFPWTGFLLSSLSKIPSLLRSPKSNQYAFLLIWALVIFLFYSASDSKLIPYIIPCFAPLAVIIASGLTSSANAAKIIKSSVIISAFVSVLFCIAFITASVRTDFLEVRELIKFGTPLMILLIVPSVLNIFFWFRHKNAAAVIKTCFISAILLCFAFQPVISEVAEHRTGKDTAQIVNEWQDSDTLLIGYQDYLQDLPFYTDSRVLLYDYLGELEFGASHQSGQGWFIKDPEQLKRIWQENPHAILVIPKKQQQSAFSTLDLKDAETAQTEKYIVVRHR